MGIIQDIISNGKDFVETATNFVGVIEKNWDAFYRLKDKNIKRDQVESINRIISNFQRIWFMNGVFFASFLPKMDKMSLKNVESHGLVMLEELNGFVIDLNEIKKDFNNNAPKIEGLGRDMVELFRRSINLREEFFGKFLTGEFDRLDEDERKALRKEFSKIDKVEMKLYKLRERIGY